MRTALCSLSLLILTGALAPLVAQTPSPGDRWVAFRGGAVGRTAAKALPTAWSNDEGVAWTASLPGTGQSSPVVFDGRVFVTSVEGEMKERNHVTCFRMSDGKLLWSRSYGSSVEQKLSNMVSKAAPTPAVDADRVYAFFESGDFIALSHEGETLWHRVLTKDYGPIEGNHGIGSSVVLSGSGVHVLVDHAGPSYLICLDRKTGGNLWRTERSPRVSWSTPIVATRDGAEWLLVSSNGFLDAYAAADGRHGWSVDGISGNTVPSPSPLSDGVLVTASKGAGAVRVSWPKSGGEKPAVQWTSQPARPSGFASPIAMGDLVLVLNKAGSLSAHSLADGSFLWRQRLAEGCWASPIVADGLLYYFGKQGRTSVVKVGLEGAELVSTNEVATESTVYGAAAVNGAFIIREDTRLLCLRAPTPSRGTASKDG